MKELLIRKSDIENLGRKVMKEVYEFLHDDYILTFEKMKIEKDKIEKYIVEYYLRNIYKIDDIPYKESKYKEYLKEIENKIEDESKFKEYLKELENKIEDESLDIDIIFKVLDLIKLEYELDEDLSSKKGGFVYIYYVFYHYHTYLED